MVIPVMPCVPSAPIKVEPPVARLTPKKLLLTEKKPAPVVPEMSNPSKSVEPNKIPSSPTLVYVPALGLLALTNESVNASMPNSVVPAPGLKLLV